MNCMSMDSIVEVFYHLNKMLLATKHIAENKFVFQYKTAHWHMLHGLPVNCHTVNSSPGQLVTQSTRHRSTRHLVDSSRSRLVTKRRSTHHKQTSKPYCQQCIGSPNFLAVVFKKQKKFTASGHQNAGLNI